MIRLSPSILRRIRAAALPVCACLVAALLAPGAAAAELVGPELFAETVATGVGGANVMAFIGDDDLLLGFTNTGKVRRVVDGELQPGNVLDVAVHYDDGRGLKGIAVDPDFDHNGRVFLFYTESATGEDTDADGIDPLGNRVYRYTWDGEALIDPQRILDLPATPGPGRHGGILAFGPDEALYVTVGDMRREGRLQNFAEGDGPDDTSVILRVHPSGDARRDNPFYDPVDPSAPMNRYLAYGVRNSLGFDFDPLTGDLWFTEIGGPDEINRIAPGFNGGWGKIAGPEDRDPQDESSLWMAPGAVYADPAFSWQKVVRPRAIAFVRNRLLGCDLEHDLLVSDTNCGQLYHFEPDASRSALSFASPELLDGVADNDGDLCSEEQAEILFGTGFTKITDIKTGPDGRLYLLSSLDGVIYRLGVAAGTFPDADGDAVDDGCDCDADDPLAYAEPQEIRWLRPWGQDPTDMRWDSQHASAGSGTTYTLISGDLSALVAAGSFGGAEALATDLAEPRFVDERPPPPPGEAYYYLVRAENGCGLGSFGEAAAGVPDPRAELDAFVFIPRVRDELSLYRFSEGFGATVHDRGMARPPLDLTIDDPGAVSWLQPGGLALSEATQLDSLAPATKINDGIRTSGELTVEAWVRPGSVDQIGTARIVAISQDPLPNGGNVVLGQGPSAQFPDRYDMRLRTTETNQYGLPSLSTPDGAVTLERTHLAASRDAGGTTRFYVNGQPVATGRSTGTLDAWNAAYPLTLGNEPTGNRPWLGDLFLVAVYDRALTDDEILQNFRAGRVLPPAIVTQPADATVAPGETATFDVVATGTGPLAYRWLRDGVEIPGANASSYTTPPATEADAGAVFRCEVSNFAASTTSAGARLFITSRGFVEHFDDPSLDPAKWTPYTVGQGSVTLSGESSVVLEAPTAGDAAFLGLNESLDVTVSQRWLFAVRPVAAAGPSPLIGLWSTASGNPPQPGLAGSLTAELRAGIALLDDGTDAVVRFLYTPNADGLGRYWSGEPQNQWTAVGDEADAVDRIRHGTDADWYVIGFEIDGPNGRLRFLARHRWGGDVTDPDQGLRLVSLSDWIDLAEFGPAAPLDRLWLTLGDRSTDLDEGTHEVEWVRRERGDLQHGWTNARSRSAGEDYTMRHQTSLGTTWLPDGRGATVLETGGLDSWDFNGYRKKNVLRDDDGTFYMFHEAFDIDAESAIGLATATSADGPWTEVTGNPVVPRSVLPANGSSYDVLTAPWVIKDNGEADPSRRWRMLVCGEVRDSSTHRIFLLRAADPAGPWTLEPGAGRDGAVLDESAAGDWRNDGVCDPLVFRDATSGLWQMLYSGIHVDRGWSVGHATSADLLGWTPWESNPLITGDASAVQDWTGAGPGRIAVTDGSAFPRDAVVFVRVANSTEDYVMSRVRRVEGDTVELYHQVDGLTGSGTANKVVPLGAGSITPHALVAEPDGGYRLYVTAFQPFILGPGSFGNAEFVSSLTAPSILGPWTWDHLASPNVAPTIWQAQRAQENIALINEPVETASEN
jgi:glucose/arabinose dehydrogenase